MIKEAEKHHNLKNIQIVLCNRGMMEDASYEV